MTNNNSEPHKQPVQRGLYFFEAKVMFVENESIYRQGNDKEHREDWDLECVRMWMTVTRREILDPACNSLIGKLNL